MHISGIEVMLPEWYHQIREQTYFLYPDPPVMRTTFLFVFLSFACLFGMAQKLCRPDFGFPSLSDYLSKKLELQQVTDSCINGFYFISFSLNKQKKTVAAVASQGFPVHIQHTICKMIDSAHGIWNDDFAKKLIRQKRNIMIPVYLHIVNNCNWRLDQRVNSSRPIRWMLNGLRIS